MCTFKPGQLVRLVRPFYPCNQDAVGRYLAPLPEQIQRQYLEFFGWRVNCQVLFHKETASNVQHTDQLEPIVDDGHRASEFSFTELMDRCREGVSA